MAYIPGLRRRWIVCATYLAAAGCLPAAADPDAATCTAGWTRAYLGSRQDAAAAYDAAHGRVVLFGGFPDLGADTGDTWGWDGTTWTRLATTGPSPRGFHGMAYDAGRGRVVLFGGRSAGSDNGDTWVWDGNAWGLAATTGPSPRSSPHMAYDAARARVVLFGGLGASGELGDTWEWDGVSWSFVAGNGPSPRAFASLAYDAVRHRTVLFGGSAGATTFGDTWEWDGARWTRVATTGPSPRDGTALAFDSASGRTLLFGGLDAATLQPAGDTWAWDGSTWSRLATTGPSPRSDFILASDSTRGRVVLTSGAAAENGGAAGALDRSTDTWEWNGSAWSLVQDARRVGRSQHGAAYDPNRRRIVLAGGLQYLPDPPSTAFQTTDTWEIDGTALRRVSGDAPQRVGAPLAFDGRRVVLFGGFSPQGFRGETLGFDGTRWQTLAATGPDPRLGAAMAFDLRRRRVVLFGGLRPSGKAGDTWEWDGSAWTRVATTGPAPRSGHALAYDVAHRRLLLFGGSDAAGALLSDTWEWNGAAWTQLAVPGPPPRQGHAMAYDAARGKVVLTGGAQPDPGGAALADAWEWDGSAWSPISPVPGEAPEPVQSHALVYDDAAGSILQIGGASGIFPFGFLAPDQITSLGCAGAPPDRDGDGVPDATDNCLDVPNGPLTPGPPEASQHDTNGDGYGDACDSDVNHDGVVNFADLAAMKSSFFHSGPHLPADLNGDGVVNFADLAALRQRFFEAPGPSALAP